MGVMTTINKNKEKCSDNKEGLFMAETILALCIKEEEVVPPVIEPPVIEPPVIEPPIIVIPEPDIDYVQVVINMVRKDTAVTSLDLVFIQDISGSFGDDLDTVNNILDSLMNSITARISDTRFGLTTFSDIPDEAKGLGGPNDNPFTLVLPLTSDKAALKQAYASLELEYGNDDPESQLIALRETCLAPLDYRVNSKKVLLLLTDARYHTNSDDSRYPTEESVVQAINELGAFTVFGVSDSLTGDYYENLKNVLRGLTAIIGNSSQSLADAVVNGLDASQESLKFPVSGKIYNALPGSIVNLEALDSTGKVITVSTTLLDDGVFEAGSEFDGLSDGGIPFTVSGINKYAEEFTVIKTVYKY